MSKSTQSPLGVKLDQSFTNSNLEILKRFFDTSQLSLRERLSVAYSGRSLAAMAQFQDDFNWLVSVERDLAQYTKMKPLSPEDEADRVALTEARTDMYRGAITKMYDAVIRHSGQAQPSLIMRKALQNIPAEYLADTAYFTTPDLEKLRNLAAMGRNILAIASQDNMVAAASTPPKEAFGEWSEKINKLAELERGIARNPTEAGTLQRDEMYKAIVADVYHAIDGHLDVVALSSTSRGAVTKITSWRDMALREIAPQYIPDSAMIDYELALLSAAEQQKDRQAVVMPSQPAPQVLQQPSILPPSPPKQHAQIPSTKAIDDLEAAINDIAQDVQALQQSPKPVIPAKPPIPPKPQNPSQSVQRPKPPVPEKKLRGNVAAEPAQASVSTEEHTNALGGKVAESGVRPSVLEQAKAVMLLAQGVVMAENPRQPYQITTHPAIEEAAKNQQHIDSLTQDQDEKTIGPLEEARDALITEALVDMEKKVAARAAEPMTPMVSQAVDDFYKALNYMDRRYLTPELQAKVDAKLHTSAPQSQAPAQNPVGGPPPLAPKPQVVKGKIVRSTDYASPSALAASASVSGNPKPQPEAPAQNPPVGGPPPLPPKPTGEKLERMERQLSAERGRKTPPKQTALSSAPVSSVVPPQTVAAQAPVTSVAPQSAPVVPVASAPVSKPPVQKVTPLFTAQQPGQYAIAFTLSGADVNKGLKHCAHKAAEAVLAHAGASHSDTDSRTKGKFKERLDDKITDSIMRKYPDFAIMSPKAQQAIVQVTHDVLAGVTPYNAAGNTVKIIGPRPERDKGNLRGSEYEAHLAGKSDGHLIDTALENAKKDNPDVQESLELTKAAKYIFRKLTKEGGHHFYEQREGFNRQSSVHTDVGRDALADITALLKGVADKKGIPVGQLLTGPDGKMNRGVLDAVAQEANNEMGRKGPFERVEGALSAIGWGALATIGSIFTFGISARPNGAANGFFHKAQLAGSGNVAFSTSALEGAHADNIINRAAASMAVGEDGVVEAGQVSVYTVATQLMADKRDKTSLTPNTASRRSEQKKYATYLEEALKDVDTQDRAAVLGSPEFYQAASRELKGHKPNDDTAHPTITSTMRQGGAREEDVPGVASVDQSTAAQAVQGLEGVEIQEVDSSLPPPRGNHAQGVVNRAVSSGKGGNAL